MSLVLILVLAASLGGIPIRAITLRLAGRIPWFLAWVLCLVSSWLLFVFWPEKPPLEAFTIRLLLDTPLRAMAFAEMAGLLVAGRAGVRSAARAALAAVLAPALVVGVWFTWPNLQELGPVPGILYPAAVVLQRFTGFALLVFVAGFLAFLIWLRIPVASLWRWHAAAMVTVLLGSLLPDITYAESLLQSNGVPISQASALFEFTGAVCWLWGSRRPSIVAFSDAPPAEEGTLTQRMRGLRQKITPPERDKRD